VISDKAMIDEGVIIGKNVSVWEGSKIRSGVVIGDNTVIGMGVYIGPNVKIGSNCKIQNLAQIYDPAVIGDGVFVGPGVILTNDKHPSAVNQDGSVKTSSDWQPVGVVLEDFCSVGAGAICVAPVVIGKSALVAAGAVVTRDVKPNQTVVGVPAR
jgi:UDP-2-acetamido-3-amino-2,3-dideoxy-glucuronate N-acetyltransferase